MRDFDLVVPADCVVSIEIEENEYALKQIQKVLKADISTASEIDFERLKLQGGGNRNQPQIYAEKHGSEKRE